MKVWAAALALVMMGAGAARAADQPLYRPAPAWVKPIAIPKPKDDGGGGSSQVLLQDVQSRFSADGDEFYEETAVKILAAQGLSTSGNIILPWRPDTDTLVIHKMVILRGDQTIDLLAGGKTLQVLRRETNLEMAMLDGTLTATLQPEGLQVGDVLDIAYTRQSHDPVLKGHSEDWTTLMRPGVVGRAYVRAIWPKTTPVRWRITEGLPKGAPADISDVKELVLDLTDVEAPRPPRGAPPRFNSLAQLQLSDFSSWAEVSTLSQPLYAKAATLAPNSPLQVEIDRIKAASTDPKTRAMEALKLVEDKVRYLFLGLSNGGYIPADADTTWTRRFGDCKAKTALLLALLKELGVDAQPALVSTAAGDGLDERLPNMGAFDHVAVLARIAGKAYWMDGTRSGDTDLDALPMPNYHWMLPVQVAGGDLQKMLPTLYPDPMLETRMRLDASAGMDAPAPAHLEYIFRNDAGLAVQLRMQSLGRTDLDEAMRAYWRSAASWIEPKQMLFSPDTGHGAMLSMDGAATINWAKGESGRTFFLDDSSIGGEVSLQREPGPDRDAPFAVTYPIYIKRSVTVILPQKGQGFLLANNDGINKAVGGVEYKRTARLAAGIATVETSVKALTPEFPASEAPAATITLRDWSLHPVGIIANPALAAARDQEGTCLRGAPDAAIPACNARISKAAAGSDALARGHYGLGRAYSTKGAWTQAAQEYTEALKVRPADTDTLVRRGYAYLRKGDVDRSLADFGEGLRLDPNQPEILQARGIIYAARKDWDRAIQDYSAAIKLRPTFRDAVFSRGQAHEAKFEIDLAILDYSRATELNPKEPEAWRNLGVEYTVKKDWALAIRNYDEALRLKPDFQLALYDRGRANVAQGKMDAAIDDFNQLVRLSPRDPNMYLTRGIAYAAKADMEHAIPDFDEALRLKPDMAAAFGSRGPARIQQGAVDEGFKDLDQLVRMQPSNPVALNQRCWERAKLGKDLGKALADCDAALRLAPTKANILDSRGLVHLRREEYQSALADCDAAIQLDPRRAPTLFVRGLAKRRLGRLEEGDADIALAEAASPNIAEIYAKMGVTR